MVWAIEWASVGSVSVWGEIGQGLSERKKEVNIL